MTGEGRLEIQERVSLAPLTTLRIGGEARFFAEIGSEEQLRTGLEWAHESKLPVMALGGGSNLLVHDEGFPGLVLHLGLRPEVQTAANGAMVEYTFSGGMPWESMVDRVCGDGLSGVECLAGIPGLTGAAPVQNIGAYGQEVAQTIRRVRAWDREAGAFVNLDAEVCGFGYRQSRFQGARGGAVGRFLITAVTFGFTPGERPELTYAELRAHFAARTSRPDPEEVAAAVRAIRRGKGMVLMEGEPDARSAGSFFKNPIRPATELAHTAAAAQVAPEAVPHWPVPGAPGAVKLSAAWLVERAGFVRGFRLGAAAVSSRHTLALTNYTGDATYQDITRLRDAIRGGVSAHFGVELEQEPIELGPTTQDPFAGR